MRVNSEVRFLGSRDCKYTMRGRKLTELRRAELRPIARALKVDDGPQRSKNELLRMILGKLSAINAPEEIAS